MRRDVVRAGAYLVCVLTVGACRSAQQPDAPAGGQAPVPDIPSPVHRTPTITLPPATVTRPPNLGERLAYSADSIRGAAMWSAARWGMLVVDAARGDTLLSRDADKLFVPASNQKLLTAAVALTVLGESYRWATPVLLRGRQVGSTWRGDLLFEGMGDPSWSDSLQAGNALDAFEPVVAALRARGISRIDGRVIAVGDAFPGSTVGSGWEVEDLDGVFGAAVDELMLNEGAFRLEVAAGSRTGVPLVVSRRRATSYPPVVMQANTAHGGEPLRAEYDSTSLSIVVSGTLAVGERRVFNMAYRHPNDAVRAAVQEKLERSGVSVSGKSSAAGNSIPLDTLVVLQSAPMPDIVRRMQKVSQNQVAELLYRTAGRVASGSGEPDSARAVANRTLASLGIDSASVVVRDGSGMSRHNFVTPRALVRVLDAMQRSASAATFRDALPVAGVDGTLRNRMRGTAAQDNVRAKTGTLDKARSLSGFVTTADGRTLLFSLLCNNYTTSAAEVDRAVETLLAMLASSRANEQ